jgi:superfamily I DNA and/or RNA helicase
VSNSFDIIKNLQLCLKHEKEEELKQFNEALKNLNTEQKVKAGICWYPIEIKESGYGLGDYPFLVIQRHRHKEIRHKFDGGKQVSLFSGNPQFNNDQVRGTIHFVTPDTMKVIFFTNDLPDWVDEGKIGVQLHFDESGYKEMDKALENLLNSTKNRLAELRDILYGTLESQYNLDRNYTFNPLLNNSQNLAIKNVLQSNDVALVHGPPGTGKTTTITYAIKELVKYESQVLVCAPSNAAADLLTERLASLGIYVLRIGNLSRIDQEVLKHTVEEKLTGHSEYKRVKEYKKQADEYRRMALKYKRSFGPQEREQRKLLLKEAKNLAGEAVDMEYRLVDSLVDNAQAIVCTLIGSAHKFLEGRIFKTIVIDEAAQALEPACWVAIQKAQKVIMTGDPYQLPATVKSIEAVKLGLSVSLMEKGISYLPNNNLLNTQYRMNERIMYFSNYYFYQNKLEAHQSVRDRLLKVFQNNPVEFIDTAGCGFEEKENAESQSLFNPDEAELLNKHLENLCNDLIEHTTIGIISPYREQVNYLKDYISVSNDFAYLSIDTIDSFQGRESDIVYISLVRSNEKGVIGFLKDYRRLNVALTRAKLKLVVIGDSATLGSDNFYKGFIEFCQENNFYKSAWEYLDV